VVVDDIEHLLPTVWILLIFFYEGEKIDSYQPLYVVFIVPLLEIVLQK
jgi:hypothetical protein